MKYLKTSYGYLLRLTLGEKVTVVLKKFIKDKEIKSAVFWAIGALESVNLSFYDLKNKKYLGYEIKNPVEVVSMTGNIAWMENDVVIHCHGVFSDSEGKTSGGHFNEGVVGPTLEIMLFLGSEKMEREFDEVVGLNLLKIR